MKKRASRQTIRPMSMVQRGGKFTSHVACIACAQICRYAERYNMWKYIYGARWKKLIFFLFFLLRRLARSHLDSFDKLHPTGLDIGHVDNLCGSHGAAEKCEVFTQYSVNVMCGKARSHLCSPLQNEIRSERLWRNVKQFLICFRSVFLIQSVESQSRDLILCVWCYQSLSVRRVCCVYWNSSAEKPQHHDDDVKVGSGSGRVQLQRAGTIIEKTSSHCVWKRSTSTCARERSRKWAETLNNMLQKRAEH